MTSPDPSREAFEKWYCPDEISAERESIFRIKPDGNYFNIYTQARYEGWQAGVANGISAIREDVITANLMIHVGLDKHTARECERIVRQLLQSHSAAPKQEGST